jgi:hypothetical protein
VYKAHTRPGGFDLSMVVEWGSYGDKVGVGKTMSCKSCIPPKTGNRLQQPLRMLMTGGWSINVLPTLHTMRIHLNK